MKTASLAWVIAALVAAGCEPQEPAKPKEAKPSQQEHSFAQNAIRGREIQENQNDLRQIALLFKTFEVDMNHVPRSQDEFVDYIKKDAPNLVAKLKDGTFVLVFERTPGGENPIVAYEKTPDLNHRQIAARSDATVTLMEAKDLEAALKKK
jgi:hypothetical protein